MHTIANNIKRIKKKIRKLNKRLEKWEELEKKSNIKPAYQVGETGSFVDHDNADCFCGPEEF